MEFAHGIQDRIFSYLGVPTIFHSDNGGEFNNPEIIDLAEKSCIPLASVTAANALNLQILSVTGKAVHRLVREYIDEHMFQLTRPSKQHYLVGMSQEISANHRIYCFFSTWMILLI